MRGFIKVQTDSEHYVAVDQISDFTSRDPYRPGGSTRIMLKDGTTIVARESVDEIAQQIIKAGEG